MAASDRPTPTASPLLFLEDVLVRDASRLTPSKYDQPPVLSKLTGLDNTRLNNAYTLDSLTNPRLTGATPCAQQPGFLLPDNHLLHSHIVNGAFIHGSPDGRFSASDCGTWYSAATLPTAQKETGFHLSLQYTDLVLTDVKQAVFPQRVHYSQWLATYANQLHRVNPDHPDTPHLLDPSDYRESQRVAGELRAQGALGLVYPSVRDPGGQCHAIFQPSVVQAVRKASQWVAVTTHQHAEPSWESVAVTG